MIYPNIHVTQSRVGPLRDIGGIYDMVGFSCWVSCLNSVDNLERLVPSLTLPFALFHHHTSSFLSIIKGCSFYPWTVSQIFFLLFLPAAMALGLAYHLSPGLLGWPMNWLFLLHLVLYIYRHLQINSSAIFLNTKLKHTVFLLNRPSQLPVAYCVMPKHISSPCTSSSWGRELFCLVHSCP